jgi:hypothetical protein
MACQSLDNDEILNVRWATEDPNPQQKATERERLEQLGENAIQGKIDSRVVEAIRSIKALEEEESLDWVDASEDHSFSSLSRERESEEASVEEREKKRRRVQHALESNSSLSSVTLKNLGGLVQVQRQLGKPIFHLSSASIQSQGIPGLSAYDSD